MNPLNCICVKEVLPCEWSKQRGTLSTACRPPAGISGTEGPAIQASPGLASGLVQGFSGGLGGILPASRNEVQQELQVQELTLERIAQRLNQLTPVHSHPPEGLEGLCDGHLRVESIIEVLASSVLAVHAVRPTTCASFFCSLIGCKGHCIAD